MKAILLWEVIELQSQVINLQRDICTFSSVHWANQTSENEGRKLERAEELITSKISRCCSRVQRTQLQCSSFREKEKPRITGAVWKAILAYQLLGSSALLVSPTLWDHHHFVTCTEAWGLKEYPRAKSSEKRKKGRKNTGWDGKTKWCLVQTYYQSWHSLWSKIYSKVTSNSVFREVDNWVADTR